MIGRRRPRALGWLAILFVRGPEAPFVRADLDDSHDRDLARGLPAWRAHGRYVVNTLVSSSSLLVERLRPSGLRPSWIDVRLGLRMLVKYPVLTGVALFTLAIGIPVGVAPAHFADALEAPLPIHEARQVRLIRYWDLEARRRGPTTISDFLSWRDTLTSFESLGAVRAAAYNVDTGSGQVASVSGAELTASTFGVLGAQPQVGRFFIQDDERAGAAAIVVIGHGLWRARLDGDPAVVGRTIRLDGIAHTVVGVMPAGFAFPASQQLWLPLRDRPMPNPRDERQVSIFGRLASNATPERAEAEVRVAQLARAGGGEVAARFVPEVLPTSFLLMGGLPKGGFRSLPEFRFIQILTLVPLFVACANVGLLIFARTATRSSEFAVRTALGASRARILTQVFTESLVLSVAAASVSLLLGGVITASGLVTRFMGGMGIELPDWVDFGLTGTTVLRALGLAVLSAVIAGVAPIFRVTGRSINQSIQRARAGRSGTRFGGLTSALLVADVAIAVAIVGFAVALADKARATIDNGQAVGIEASRYLAAELRLPGGAAAPSATAQQAVVDRLEAEPGVRGVTVANVLPRMDHDIQFVELDGEELPPGSPGHGVRTAQVDTGFFDALGKPVLMGRPFNAADLSEGASTVIVNTTFVERLLGGANPIGRRVRYVSRGLESRSSWYEIVGVVGPLGMHVLTPEQDEGIYHPAAPGSINPVWLAVDVGPDPEQFAPRLRTIVRDAAPNAVVTRTMSLDQAYEGDSYLVAALALGAVLMMGVLLMLAASGIYAIMSFSVAERTREIGIRVALGANRGRIAWHVARRALIQLAAGALLGMPIAALAFFELQEGAGRDPSVILATLLALVPGVGIMILVGVVACAAPTLRALRVTPVEALKVEG
ncbi:MAG TPA: ABC transporter permease [Vicinamibacterales bacterium]|nr:ABC transporter permease [Vicinamibacterales bacterium]